jgi:hypothetical protein
VDVTISMRGHVETVGQTSDNEALWYQSPELDPSGRPEMLISKSATGYRLAYCDDTTFVIDPTGSHINVQWTAPLNDVDAASYLTGSVLAFVLRLRGSVPLHASAVAIEGRALLFVGDSWAGKSSTAAAFSILGYPVLSDDIVRIDTAGDGLAAYPSHPRLNVWPDSATTLYGAPDALPVHSESYGKHYLDLIEAGYAFQATPVPIEAVYLLGERSPDRRSPLMSVVPARPAFMALLGHTFGSAFLDPAMRVREFDVLCRLVECVLVRELRFGDDLGALVSSCRALAGDPAGQEGPALRA